MNEYLQNRIETDNVGEFLNELYEVANLEEFKKVFKEAVNYYLQEKLSSNMIIIMNHDYLINNALVNKDVITLDFQGYGDTISYWDTILNKVVDGFKEELETQLAYFESDPHILVVSNDIDLEINIYRNLLEGEEEEETYHSIIVSKVLSIINQ